MGEIGIPRDIFLHTLTWVEIRLIIDGYRRRERTQWLTTRWLIWSVGRIAGSKTDSPEEMVQFPWEKERADPEREAEELRRLIEESRKMNEGITHS